MANDPLELGRSGATEEVPLASGLRRLLAVEPGERSWHRLMLALVEIVPEAACAALLSCENGERFVLSAGVGLDESIPEPFSSGLCAEAIESGAMRLAADPGRPFPSGTLVGAAAPFSVGATRGTLCLGARDRPFDEDSLLLLRAAADRAGLLLEREQLTREREEAAGALKRAEADVEHRRHALDTILGVVGHDLRNPLGAVHMSAALLQKRGGLQGWQARTVERMRSSAGRMERIIADLLSYTRTRFGAGIPIERREADLGDVVRAVVDELRAANPDRELVVSSEGDLTGTWDPDRLGQVASNIVSNAIDHGDPAFPVRITLSGHPRDVVLEVRNGGSEMPPEALEHLFEPFSRPPDEHCRKASGLGLGLYISREIVRGHRGEISAEVTKGDTTVTVRLPRS